MDRRRRIRVKKTKRKMDTQLKRETCHMYTSNMRDDGLPQETHWTHIKRSFFFPGLAFHRQIHCLNIIILFEKLREEKKEHTFLSRPLLLFVRESFILEAVPLSSYLLVYTIHTGFSFSSQNLSIS